jgi:hypothetical protein
MKNRNKFVEKNSILVREFDRYILEHPELADEIPDNALVVMQIDGDHDFNEWARATGEAVAENDNPIVYVRIMEWCISKMRLLLKNRVRLG